MNRACLLLPALAVLFFTPALRGDELERYDDYVRRNDPIEERITRLKNGVDELTLYFQQGGLLRWPEDAVEGDEELDELKLGLKNVSRDPVDIAEVVASKLALMEKRYLRMEPQAATGNRLENFERRAGRIQETLKDQNRHLAEVLSRLSDRVEREAARPSDWQDPLRETTEPKPMAERGTVTVNNLSGAGLWVTIGGEQKYVGPATTVYSIGGTEIYPQQQSWEAPIGDVELKYHGRSWTVRRSGWSQENGRWVLKIDLS